MKKYRQKRVGPEKLIHLEIIESLTCPSSRNVLCRFVNFLFCLITFTLDFRSFSLYLIGFIAFDQSLNLKFFFMYF